MREDIFVLSDLIQGLQMSISHTKAKQDRGPFKLRWEPAIPNGENVCYISPEFASLSKIFSWLFWGPLCFTLAWQKHGAFC